MIGMTTDIVSRKPAVSHCPTLADTSRSAMSTGRATLMIVSLRITTKAETSRTVMTVRARGSSRPSFPSAGSPLRTSGRSVTGRSVTGHLHVGNRPVAAARRGHPDQATEADRRGLPDYASPSAQQEVTDATHCLSSQSNSPCAARRGMRRARLEAVLLGALISCFSPRTTRRPGENQGKLLDVLLDALARSPRIKRDGPEVVPNLA